MENEKIIICYRVDELIYATYKRTKTRCELLSLFDDKNNILKFKTIGVLEDLHQMIKDLEI